jgi:hypothetical protein
MEFSVVVEEITIDPIWKEVGMAVSQLCRYAEVPEFPDRIINLAFRRLSAQPIL